MKPWGWLSMDITTIPATQKSFICQEKDAFADCVEIFVEFTVMQKSLPFKPKQNDSCGIHYLFTSNVIVLFIRCLSLLT
jgi:hypothetical protein